MSKKDEVILGIDLGTSNSVACAYINNQPVYIPPSEGIGIYGKSFPSYVAFTDKEILVGEPAKSKFISDMASNVVRSVKKLMGSDVKKEFYGELYSPQQISGFILEKIKKDAEKFLDKTVEKAVITVPAYFDDNQRTATKDAGRIAGLDVIDLINEPTAASLAYGLNNKSGLIQRILVFDLGGGTLDVTIMQYGGGVFEVKSTSGDTHLGGNDMDYALMSYLVKEFEKKHNTKVRLNDRNKNRLIDIAEKAKIELSSSLEADVYLPTLAVTPNGTPLDLEITITRSKFESLISHIIKSFDGPLNRALDDANLTKSDLDKLIFVGGPTRMPIVRDYVENFMGMKAVSGIDPMDCVAQGAAIKAGVESGEIEGVTEIRDVTPLSLGLVSKGRLTEVLIDRNTKIPVSRSRKFTTVKNNQRFINVEIVQGEFKMADQNAYLGSFSLDIKPAPKGHVIVEITFEIDKDGILNVIAKDQSSRNKKSLKLDSPNKMSESEINRAIAKVKENAKNDKNRAKLVRIKNEADSAIIDAQNLIDSGYISYSDKDSLNAKILELQSLIEEENEIKMQFKTNSLKNDILRIRFE